MEPRDHQEAAQDLLERLVDRAEGIRDFVFTFTPPLLRPYVCPDDLLQEISLSAFRTLESFRCVSESSFDRWLTIITKNKMADALRTARTKHRLGRQADAPAVEILSESYLDFFDILAAPQLTPSGENAIKEAVAAIRCGLRRLPDDHRRVLEMYYLDGKPISEIASTMRKTNRAVEGLVHRGLRQMRRQLGYEGKYFSDAGSSADIAGPKRRGAVR